MIGRVRGAVLIGSASEIIAFAASLFLALGAGAIAQVVYEVGRLIARQSAEEGAPLLSPITVGELAAGIAIMYAMALLVAA